MAAFVRRVEKFRTVYNDAACSEATLEALGSLGSELSLNVLLPSDFEIAVDVLSGAFSEDPFLLWQTHGDVNALREHCRWLSRYTLTYCHRFGVALVVRPPGEKSSSIWGVLCMVPPSQYSPQRSLEAMAACGEPPEATGGRSEKAAESLQAIRSEVTNGRPHWHLWMVGSAKSARGKGVGTLALRVAVALADRDGVEMYLETNSAFNVALYEKHGFVTVKTFVVHDRDGDSDTLYGMIRAPKTVGGKLLLRDLPLIRTKTGAILLVKNSSLFNTASSSNLIVETNVELPSQVVRVGGTEAPWFAMSCGFTLSELCFPSGKKVTLEMFPHLGLIKDAPVFSHEGEVPVEDDSWAKDLLAYEPLELPYGRMYCSRNEQRVDSLFELPPQAVRPSLFIAFLARLLQKKSIHALLCAPSKESTLIDDTWPFCVDDITSIEDVEAKWSSIMSRPKMASTIRLRPLLSSVSAPSFSPLTFISRDCLNGQSDAAIYFAFAPSSCALFCPFTDASLLGNHFCNFLGNMSSLINLYEINLVSETESALFQKWNSTQHDWKDEGKTLPQVLFDTCCSLTEAVAVKEPGGDTITFEGLLHRCGALAALLNTKFGVCPGARVAVLCTSSIDFVVGMVATLFAGGCYVPIDPKYPEDRIAYILSDCSPVVVLTQKVATEHLPKSWPESRIIFLDSWKDIAAGTSSFFKPASIDDLAYIIYTSGSTGKPKGVMVPHRGLMNTLRSIDSFIHFNPGDLVLHFYGLGFDGTVMNVFTPLMAGSTVLCRDNDNFAAQVIQEKCSVGMFTPSAMTVLDQEVIDQFRAIVVGGEALTPAVVAMVKPHTILLNVYGPTEVTIVSSAIISNNMSRISIGKPFPNMTYHVVDSKQQLLPLGAVGEILIGGIGVADGYVNLPERTAGSFLQDVFGPGTGRFYRSGDLGKWCDDGTMECIGRNDSQVKVRGFRIELGEIELALQKIPGVTNAVVILVSGEQLIAFVTPELVIEDIFSRIAKELPVYMTPTAIMALASLPMTINAKVDKAKLLALYHASLQGEQSGGKSRKDGPFDPPKTTEQKVVASLLEKCLGLQQRVSLQDDFVLLGGTSLQAIRLVNALNGEFRCNLSVRELFAHRTVHALAELVMKNRGTFSSSSGDTDMVARLHRTPRTTKAHPVSLNQERLITLHQMDPKSPSYNVPLHLVVKGTNVAKLSWAVNVLLSRHELFRSVYSCASDGSVQQTIQEVAPLCEVISLTNEKDSAAWTRKALSLSSAQLMQPFDLRQSSVRAVILDISDGLVALLLTFHHVCIDGLSIGPLLNELATLLRGDSLSALPFQYLDYVYCERKWISGDSLNLLVNQYEVLLKGTTMDGLMFKGEKPISVASTKRYFLSTIPSVLVNETRRFCAKWQTTMNATLMAVVGQVLGTCCNSTDFLIGSVSANRSLVAGIENMLGYFVQTVPVRVDLHDNPTFAELAKRVGDFIINVMALESCPFSMLVDKFDKNRPAGRSAMFQVFFSFVDFPILQAFSHPSVTIGPLDENAPPPECKFDLEIEASIRADGSVSMLWQYNGKIYPEEVVRDYSRRFLLFLETVMLTRQELASTVPGFSIPLEPMVALVACSDDSSDGISSISQTDLSANALSPVFLHLQVPATVTFSAAKCLDRAVSLYHSTEIISQGERPLLLLFQGNREALVEESQKLQRSWTLGRKFSCIILDAVDLKSVVVFLASHPSVADRSSLKVFADSLQTDHVVKEELSFRDYAVWESKNFVGNRLRDCLHFFSRTLGSSPCFVDLPTDFVRPSVLSKAYGSVSIAVAEDQLSHFTSFATRKGVSASAAFCAFVGVTVARHAINQASIIVACSVENRVVPGTSSLIGPLKNMIPVVIDLDDDPLIGSMCSSVEKQLFDSNAMHAVPFQLVSGVLDQYAGTSRTPLCQVGCCWTDLYAHEIPTHGEGSHLLEIWIEMRGKNLFVSFNQGLYEESSMKMLATHLVRLMSLVEDVHCTSSGPFMSEDEAREVAFIFNHMQDCPISQGLLHEAFEKFCMLQPSSLALQLRAESMTYIQLNAAASRLCLELHRLGLKKGDFISVFCERGFEYIIGALAILKLGAIYVPLDLSYPMLRVEYILQDSAARGIVTSRSTSRARVPSSFKGHVVVADPLNSSPLSVEEVALLESLPKADPNDLAYMIYTSGTTGNPKGVELEHKSVVQYVAFWSKAIGCCPSDRYMWFSGVAFDASVEEIWGSLSSGACVVIRTDVWLEDVSRCTIFGGTPSALTVLEPAQFPGLRAVVVGGEDLPLPLAQAWRKHVQLLNSYGPTECAVACSLKCFDRTGPEPRRVTIGKPNFNMSCYVVDSKNRLLPFNVPGELCFAGLQVARGYHNLEKQTLDKFLSNPFVVKGEEADRSRMYKTGDLGRILPSGEIQYLGRVDQQVKLRGFRIEISCVESVFQDLEGVRSVVVIVVQPGSPDAALVAYVCPGNLNASTLKEKAAIRLPEYMVPHHIVPLDELPKTSNGKIDKKALPQDFLKHQLGGQETTQKMLPTSPLEQQIADAMKQVLKKDGVIGANEHFFDLGGNSITAMKLTFVLRGQGQDLDVTDVISRQTIAGIAELLSKKTIDSAGAISFDLNSLMRGVDAPDNVLVQLGYSPRASENTPAVVLLHGTNGALGSMRGLARHILEKSPRTPVFGLHVAKSLQVRSIAQLAASYLAALRRKTSGPFCFAGEGAGGIIALEMVRQCHLLGEQVVNVVLVGRISFDNSTNAQVDALVSLGTHLGIEDPKAFEKQLLSLSDATRRIEVLSSRVKWLSGKEIRSQVEMWQLFHKLCNSYLHKMESREMHGNIAATPFLIGWEKMVDPRVDFKVFEREVSVSSPSCHWARVSKDCTEAIVSALLYDPDLLTQSQIFVLPDFASLSAQVDLFVSMNDDRKSLAASQMGSLNAPSKPVLRRVATLESVRQEKLDASLLGVSELTLQLSQSAQGGSELEDEANLPMSFLDSFIPSEPPLLQHGFSGSSFLTGATGFLGPFLLKALLDASPNVTVYCVARASSDKEARRRVLEGLQRTGCSSEDEGRVVVFAGDLGLSHYGLSAEVWAKLCVETSFIVHNGSTVNHVLGHAQLRGPNIDGTLTMLELACSNRPKRVVVVTTVGTVPILRGETVDTPAKETTHLVKASDVAGESGYVTTKWVMEQLAVRAAGRGLRVSIARPAMIGWDSASGVANDADWVTGLIRACILVGVAPITEQEIAFAPVRYVADGIIAPLYSKRFQEGGVVHLAHSQKYRYSVLFDAIAKALKPKELQRLPYSQWMEAVRHYAHSHPEESDVLAPTLMILGRLSDLPGERAYVTENAKIAVTLAHKEQAPPLTETYFDVVVKFLMNHKKL